MRDQYQNISFDEQEIPLNNAIHFISGLPRSGSTLLAALLRQNPRFVASVTSPVFQMFSALQAQTSGKHEFQGHFDEDRRRNILRGLFNSYYEDVRAHKVVFDTNRAWSTKLAALERLFPTAKMICCVRPIPQILDSIERIVRLNALEPSRLFNFEGANNVYSRADVLNGIPTGLIGSAYAGLREAFYGPFSDKLLLITYDSLVRRPDTIMKAIYDFIEEKPFAHDFENVEFDVPHYDNRLGLPGLHRVGGPIRPREHEMTLPPDLIKRFETGTFWSDKAQNPQSVRVL